MAVYEITGTHTGVSKEGVNFLQPADSYQNMYNGFIYRQVLQSRFGFTQFSLRRVSDNIVTDNTRIMGIFENVLTSGVNNIRETLVVTKKFLYRYNDTTNVFDRIPMAGSAPAGGFNIISNNEYVSGTTYPFKDGTNRFLFTGKGMTDVYSYNGTNVQSFTLDNPDYADPIEGALTNAWYIIWFGERLNLFYPTIAGQTYPQAVLYSGIRDTLGNGDKFNVPGAGLLSADTYEYLNGACVLGNVIIANFSQSNWTLEKTRDAFNPYFWRKIPSVLGTDASFSFQEWNDEVRSLGRTGIIRTDNRVSLRIDNKIPFFTADEIDQELFDLTYGGFDPIRGQFLFSYLDKNSDESLTQDKVLVNNYEETTWAINDQRFSVFGNSTNGINFVMNDIYEVNNPSWIAMDSTEEIWNRIGIGKETQKTLAGDDDGFVYELNQDFDDYFATISAITNAPQAVLTVADSAFKAGDRVTISNVEGMTEINNFDPLNPYAPFTPYTVVSATNTSITIDKDSSDFGIYTPDTGSITKVISFYAQTIPFNPFRSQGLKCRISHVEFLLDCNAGFLEVDVFEDEESTPFKSNILVIPDSDRKGRQWVEMSINNEANFMTFALKQESPALQVRLTSMRIHCEPGAYTSA